MTALLKVAGFLLALTCAVAALEAQYLPYAVSTLRQATGTAPATGFAAPAAVIDPEARSLTLLAAGDIADCPMRPGLPRVFPTVAHVLGWPSAFDLSEVAATKTARLAEAWPEAPILALGDLVYNSGTPAEFADCFDPIWRGLSPRTLPTPGNHEYATPGAFGYYDYWGARAGPERRGYYAVETADWLILSLNSEIAAGPGSDQGRWLQDRLDAAPDKCVLAVFHKPAQSLQHRGDSEAAGALFRQLQRNGATAVLNGHNHFYERTAPLDAAGRIDARTGTRSFIVGSGGRMSKLRPTLATTEKAIFRTTGLLRLSLEPGQYRWWYHAAQTGAALDSGAAPCNPARPSPGAELTAQAQMRGE
ncbi:MAG: alkaline phosphatase [Rhodobacteraceae bacterium]|nr:MAG: alkaline phosphatase [Paracoccaceae bacterium]